MQGCLDGVHEGVSSDIASLSAAADTMAVIERIDRLYNNHLDRAFLASAGTLEKVLAVSVSELADAGNWNELFSDEIYGKADDVSTDVPAVAQDEEDDSERQDTRHKASRIVLDEEALARVRDYVVVNYGPSMLPVPEDRAINHQLCRGLHSDCSLIFTRGVLASPGPDNYKRKYLEKQYEKNKMAYYDNYRVIRRNIDVLTAILRNEMLVRSQPESRRSDAGAIAVDRLWRVGRAPTSKLFERSDPEEAFEFTVDVLIDASGSQSSRQSKVAIQSFIISEALSNVAIPHRVMGFCSFWDYTVMTMYRDYDDDRAENAHILEFTASSNNRDGLAVRAAAHGLAARAEANKILIVLSDGRPNDVNVNRPGARNPAPYTGEPAVRDTASEVRRVRAAGISVLGVFAGREEDLASEKSIFGRDFAYIRDIGNFSNLVGMYLKRQIDNT
jgi:hypothetical protein